MPFFSAPSYLRTRKILLRLTIVLAVILLVMIGVIKLVERAKNDLTLGFESYLTQLTGHPAEIGSLDQVQFFPHVWVSLSDLRFWPIDNPDGSIMTVGKVAFRIPLWSMMIGNPRFIELEMSNLKADGAVTKGPAGSVTRLGIDRDADQLVFSGALGDMTVNASLPMERANKDGTAYYAPRPPIRLSGALKGGQTSGDYFFDLNEETYGATITFQTYRPQDMRGIQLLLQQALAGQVDRTFPVQVHIERLIAEKGTSSGPHVIETVRLEKGELQPLECFFNNQGQIKPCQQYLGTAPGMDKTK